MDNDWSRLLSAEGDPVEQLASSNFELHIRFERYCEVWGRCVYPNRDSNDHSKFKQGFPIELEDLFNHHYGIWYHITFAYQQLSNLQKSAYIDEGDPLFHLAAAVDLVESVFVIGLIITKRLKNEPPFGDLDRERFLFLTQGLWQRNEVISEFEHEAEYEGKTGFFYRNTKETRSRQKFQRIKERIRGYRNIITHNLPPLRIPDASGRILIPRWKALHKYKQARWSSGRLTLDRQDFEFAEIVLRNFADQLVKSLNLFWEDFLEDIVSVITASPEYREWFRSKEKVEFEVDYLESPNEFPPMSGPNEQPLQNWQNTPAKNTGGSRDRLDNTDDPYHNQYRGNIKPSAQN